MPFIGSTINFLGKYIENKIQEKEKEYIQDLEKKIPEKFKKLLITIVSEIKNNFFFLENLNKEKNNRNYK